MGEAYTCTYGDLLRLPAGELRQRPVAAISARPLVISEGPHRGW